MQLCLLSTTLYFMLYCRSLLKAVIILLPLLGITWIIGILAVNNDTQVFAWIFAILNSLQVNKINCKDSFMRKYNCTGCFHIDA